MKWDISLSIPDIGQKEIVKVTEVLNSKWLTMGPNVQKFEKDFAKKMNVKHALSVTNCTAALHISSAVLGVGPGDEVICPALTFVASANASKCLGADVVFADVSSNEDLTIDPKDIERLITDKTKAIIAVHYAGFSCDMDAILKIAQKHNLKVIEDCAHSPFARYKKSSGDLGFLGSLGDLGCFSFYGNKNMTTGEGGMVTTNSDELAEKIRLMRSHGMTSLSYDKIKGRAEGYDVLMPGYNYRFDDIRAAIGLCQLEKIDANNELRRNLYGEYIKGFAASDKIIVPFANSDLTLSACHIMPIIFKNIDDLNIAKEVLRENKIQFSKHYEPIPRFSSYGGIEFKSKAHIAGILTLPLGTHMTTQGVRKIVVLIG